MKALWSGMIVVLLGASSVSQAAIVCSSEKGGFAQQPLTVTVDLETREASVQVGPDSVQIPLDHSVWDGHETGLITGPGFALVYNNWFGCIRNAKVIINVRLSGSVNNIDQVEFAVCRGGTTSDQACGALN